MRAVYTATQVGHTTLILTQHILLLAVADCIHPHISHTGRTALQIENHGQTPPGKGGKEEGGRDVEGGRGGVEGREKV